MALKRQNHTNLAEVSAELKNLSTSKEDTITLANRAPLSSDKGRLWIKYTATAALYVRHPDTGAWTTL